MSKTIGSVVIDIEANTQKLTEGFARAEQRVKKTQSVMKNTLMSLAGAYMGFAGVRAFKNLISDSIESADSLGKMAQALGMSTKGLSELKYAGSYADVGINQLNQGLSAMVRRMNNFKRDGTGASIKAMHELGISASFARHNFTSVDKTFSIIMQRLHELPRGFEKTSIAQDIFSKNAAGVLRISDLSTQQFKKLSQEGEKLGLIFGDDIANKAAKLDDTLNLLHKHFEGLGNKIAFSLLPILNDLGDNLNKNYDAYVNDIKIVSKIVESYLAYKVAMFGLKKAIIGINLISKVYLITSKSLLVASRVQAISSKENIKVLVALRRAMRLTSISADVLKASLISSGVGAIVVGLGFAVEYFLNKSNEAKISTDDFSKSLDKLGKNKGIKSLNQQLDETKNKLKKLNEMPKGSLASYAFSSGNEKAHLKKKIAVLQEKISLKNENQTSPSGYKPNKKAGDLVTYYESQAQYAKAWLEKKYLLEQKYDSLTFKQKSKLIESLHKKYENSHKIDLSSWQSYYEKLGEFSTSWYLKEEALKKKYQDMNLNKKDINQALDRDKKNYFKENIYNNIDSSIANSNQKDLVKDTTVLVDKLMNTLKGKALALAYSRVQNDFINKQKSLDKNFIKQQDNLNKFFLLGLNKGLGDALSQTLTQVITQGTTDMKQLLTIASNSLKQSGQSDISNSLSSGFGSLLNGGGFGMSNLYTMGAGLALTAIGDIMAPATKTLIKSENYLSQIVINTQNLGHRQDINKSLNGFFSSNIFSNPFLSSAKQQSILSAPKYRNITSYSMSRDATQSRHVTQEKYYDLRTQKISNAQDIANRFDKLYSNIQGANQKVLTKIGTKTYHVYKKGFLGIGHENYNYTVDIMKTFTKKHIQTMAFLSQFGIDKLGKLTKDGVSKFTKAFSDLTNTFYSISKNGLTKTQSLQQDLDKLNLSALKTNFIDKYKGDFKSLGLDLNKMTQNSMSFYLNQANISKLITKDSSLNIGDLSKATKELNLAYKKEKELKSAIYDAFVKNQNYDKAQLVLKENAFKAQDLSLLNSTQAVYSFVNSLDSFNASIDKTIDKLKTGASTSNTSLISSFWSKEKEAKQLLAKGNLSKDEKLHLKDLVTQIQNLSTNIQSKSTSANKSQITSNLLDQLQDLKQAIAKSKNSLNKNAITSLVKLASLNQNQAKDLTKFLSLGKISQAQLLKLNLSKKQNDKLIISLDKLGLLVKSSSLDDLVKKQNSYTKDLKALLAKTSLNLQDFKSGKDLSAIKDLKLQSLFSYKTKSKEDEAKELARVKQELSFLSLEDKASASADLQKLKASNKDIYADTMQILKSFGISYKAQIPTIKQQIKPLKPNLVANKLDDLTTITIAQANEIKAMKKELVLLNDKTPMQGVV